jgi:hypothetical protein
MYFVRTICYPYCVKRTAKSHKSAKVKAERGHSPEEIVTEGELLDAKPNPRYPGQRLEIYLFDGYVWVVPVVIETEELKTAFKSRKLKKEYGK